jgi:hypothetical protein
LLGVCNHPFGEEGTSGVTRQPNAIDFWRGFALITIFINHIPGLYFETFTHRNFSISDSADLFVFLAGWALFLSVGGSNEPTPTGKILSRLGSRVVTIYAAQLLISCIAIAMLAKAATYLENPLLLEWHNAAAIFYDPVNAHIGLAMLTYQLGYFDILPLYVVLMMIAPVIVLIYRYAPSVLLPLSFFIYLGSLVFEVSPQSWPTAGNWFFNPLAWQFLFVLGFVLADKDGLGGFTRAWSRPLMFAGIPLVILGALIMQLSWWPDPFAVPDPKLLFIADKTYMTPIRLIQFLALVAVFAAVYPYLGRLVPSLAQFLSMLGRNSLNVFCVGSLLSLGCQILRFVYERSIMIDTGILVFGVAALGLTAWITEWRGGTASAKSAQQQPQSQSVSFGR